MQGELVLTNVETATGFWSPNSTELFPFHVHFKGRGSPWILGAHSNVQLLVDKSFIVEELPYIFL